MITAAKRSPATKQGITVRFGTVSCGVTRRSHLSETGGVPGGATFKHLIIAGELYGY
jgi:hypothetical protein